MRLDGLGVVAGLAAALAFAWYNIGGGELLNKYDRWSVMMWALAGAAVFWQLLNPPWKPVAAQYSPAQWAFMAGFAICSVLLPFSFYFAGLQLLDPTRAIVGSCLEPVLSILIAAAALGETMGLLQGLGIVLVLAAIILAQIPERRREVLNKNVECPGRMPVYTCELVGHERQE
jgi:drug/metabolite transporter (DMT)-like permease